MGRKRKKPWYEERGNITPRKPKQRGGWITEDPGDSPQRKAKVKSWRSPATPTNKNHKRPMLTAGHYTSSQSSKNTQKFYSRNSTWQGSAKASQHRFSASRFGSSSSDAVRRHYDWWQGFILCVDLEGNDCKRKMMWVCHTSYDLVSASAFV